MHDSGVGVGDKVAVVSGRGMVVGAGADERKGVEVGATRVGVSVGIRTMVEVRTAVARGVGVRVTVGRGAVVGAGTAVGLGIGAWVGATVGSV